MENEIKNVRLSFSCPENWGTFEIIDERSRRCSKCQYKVVDFTHSTREELDRSLVSEKSVCGRFKTSQVHDTFLKLAAASLVVVASTATAGCTDEHDAGQQAQLQNRSEHYGRSEVNRIVMGIPFIPRKNDSTHLRIIPKIIPDPAKQKKASFHHKTRGKSQ